MTAKIRPGVCLVARGRSKMKGRSIDELIILKKGGFIVGETDRGLSPHYLGRRPPAVGVEYKGVISEVGYPYGGRAIDGGKLFLRPMS